MSRIQVVRLHEAGQPLRLGTAEKPSPGRGQALVKVEACGLVPNSSNVVNGRTPFLLPELPAIFGLDVAGVVESLGDDVLGVETGQRVYVDPHLTCGTCSQCRRGRKDLCRYGCLRGYFAHDENGAKLLNQYEYGGLSEYVVADASALAALPDQIDLDLAAHFGYMGTSFAALRKAGFQPGMTVLINGVTGTLGVAAVVIALGLGAASILGVGRDRELLERVAELDSRRVRTCSSEETPDLVGWVGETTGHLGVDVLYDCLGVGGDGKTTEQLLRAVRPGGRSVLVAGGVDEDICQNYSEILAQDAPMIGSNWFTSTDIDQLIALLAAGVIDASPFVTKRFSLMDANEAIEFVGTRPGGFTNVVVKPSR